MMRQTNEKAIKGKFDWVTLLTYFVLVAIGLLSIYSSQYDQAEGGKILNFALFHGKQLIWLAVALFMGFLVILTDAKAFNSIAYFVYALVMLLLMITIVIGHKENGAKGWLVLGGFQFQSSELAKFATALALAKFMSQYGFDIRNKTQRLWCFGFILFPCLLIIVQHDLGSALVFFSFFIVLYRHGLSPWYIIIPLWFGVIAVLVLIIGKLNVFFIVIGITVIINLIFRKPLRMVFIRFAACAITIIAAWGAEKAINKALEGYQRTRIEVLIGKKIGSAPDNVSILDMANNTPGVGANAKKGDSIDLKKAGWNVHQSLIAIGSGGISGKGYLKGTQTKLGYVPAQSTDFIFCTIGEETGFIGSTIVIIICVFFMFRIITIAERQKFVFNRIYAYGVVSIVLFHFTINMATVLGLFPVVGIPLPFISYGGSSLISFTILVFVLLKLDADSRALL